MRNRVLCAVIVGMAVIGSGSMAAQEVTETKEQRVRELLVAMRMDTMLTQMMDMMVGSMKQAIPDAPEEYWNEVRAKSKTNDLLEMIVPIYMKHFESADIEEMIRFHRSPTGQRLLDKQPLLMQESMRVGQEWSAKVMAEVQAEMAKKQKKP
jgi:hypothetical protein